jgi:hypothetical protein
MGEDAERLLPHDRDGTVACRVSERRGRALSRHRECHERYGEPQGNSSAAKALQSRLNLLSVIFAQFYFPAFSNGLKDVAGSIGYSWADAVSSGLESIAWRCRWEESLGEIAKRHLLIYNAQDCEALSRVAETLCDLIDRLTVKDAHRDGNPDFVRADSSELRMKSQWRSFASPVIGFEAINAAAHWDRTKRRSLEESKAAPPHKKGFHTYRTGHHVAGVPRLSAMQAPSAA